MMDDVHTDELRVASGSTKHRTRLLSQVHSHHLVLLMEYNAHIVQQILRRRLTV